MTRLSRVWRRRWRVGDKCFQRTLDDFVDPIDRNYLQLVAHILRNVLQISFVAGGQQNAMNAGAMRGQNLFFDSAHGKNQS